LVVNLQIWEVRTGNNALEKRSTDVKKISIIALVSFLIVGCAAPVLEDPYAPGRGISLETLTDSLPTLPITVGFDVDDTLLFSSPGFYYGTSNREGEGGTNKYGKDPFENDLFWREMNSGLDKFSLPKETARKLIALHKSRGDEIWFITARPKTEGETLSGLLNATFDLAGNPPVIFAGYTPKTHFIKQHRIQLYYGDSDTDVTEAQEAGIRVVRILRADISTDNRAVNVGGYGEEVLVGSDR
jgi:acid phosphatase (class B)